MTIKDDLPPSIPKGYADFADYSYGHYIIYSMKDGQKVKEGSLWSTGEILRLARTPGSYDFIIEHKDDAGRKYSKLVNVKIQHDMLTFITVDNKIIEVLDGINDRFPITTITYRVNIAIAKTPAPINVEAEPNKSDILTDLLNDPDWRARLYALSFLEKMENSRDENVIKGVGTLATDDPHRSVRKKAATFLKSLGVDVFQNVLLLENFESNNRRWISSNGRYDFFYNDEFLFSSAAGTCENEMMTSPLDLPRDFDIELVSTWKSGIGSDAYGILIGSDKDNFNHFGISGSGQAVVRQVRDEVATDLLTWTDVPVIKRHGVGQNRLRVEVRGNTWKYFVNDTYIGTITNTMKMNKYTIGLRVCRTQTIAFEQLKIRSIRN